MQETIERVQATRFAAPSDLLAAATATDQL